MKRRNAIQVILSLLVSLSLLTGCSGSPEGVAKSFIRALTSGNANKTLDYVCPKGIATVIAIDLDWNDDYYEVISQDATSAQVRVTGRVQITAKNLQQFALEMGVELPRAEAGLQVGVDFDGLMLSKYRQGWCVEKESLSNLLNYLLQLFEEELSK